MKLIENLYNDARRLREDFNSDYLDKVADRIECLIELYEERTWDDDDDGQPDDVKEHEDFAHDNDFDQWEMDE